MTVYDLNLRSLSLVRKPALPSCKKNQQVYTQQVFSRLDGRACSSLSSPHGAVSLKKGAASSRPKILWTLSSWDERIVMREPKVPISNKRLTRFTKQPPRHGGARVEN